MNTPGIFIILLILLTGCVSNNSHSEFVKTVTFSSLERFNYRHTLVSGMDFNKWEQRLLEECSQATLSAALRARGFEETAADSDFFVVAKWKKEVSSFRDIHDPIDGPLDVMQDRYEPNFRFASRLHLTVEIYQSSTGNLFWRKELPNVFDALEFTEERINDSLIRAIENFPERVEKDPNLPDIE